MSGMKSTDKDDPSEPSGRNELRYCALGAPAGELFHGPESVEFDPSLTESQAGSLKFWTAYEKISVTCQQVEQENEHDPTSGAFGEGAMVE